MSDRWQYKGGEGRWKEYVNSDTGESTIKEHKLKTVWQSCPKGECIFELSDPRTRECTCTKCGSVTYFVLGMSKLLEGKIVNLR